MPSQSRCDGSKFRYSPSAEHPLPELRRVGEVARVAVRVPALHHAVLDHQPHAALAGVVDERREDPLGLAQVVGDATAGVAADERADGHAAERGGRVDAGAQVRVDRLALGGVRVQVVVVVGERRQRRGRCSSSAARTRSASRVVEGVGRDVAGGEGPVAEPRPGGELERLVAVRAGPARRCPPAARSGMQAREEAELHVATASVRRRRRRPTRRSRAEREHRVGDAARRAGRRRTTGSPSGADPGRDRRRRRRRRRRRSSPRSPAGGRRAASRSAPRRETATPGSRRTISVAASRRAAPTASSGCSWSNASASSDAVDLEPEPVLAAGRDLADHDHRAERAAVGLELDDGGVLGLDRAAARRRRLARERLRRESPTHALGHRGERARREAGDAVAGHELGEVAPVRADVGERPRRAAERRRRRASCRPRRRAASPAGRCRGSGAPRRSRPRRHALARLADRSGRSGRRTAPRPGGPASAGGGGERARPRSRSSGERLLADHVLAGRERRVGERSSWRWLGVQMWTTSTSSVRDQLLAPEARRARRRGSRAAASRALGRRGARRPPRAPPAARTARAWTAPMNPVAGDRRRAQRPSVREPYRATYANCQAKVCVTTMRNDRRSVVRNRGLLPADGIEAPTQRPQGWGACCRLIRAGDAVTRADLAQRHRPGPLDGRPARRRAAGERADLRGGRQRVDRRAAPGPCSRSTTTPAWCSPADLGATHARLAVTDLAGARWPSSAGDLDIAEGRRTC